MPDYYFTATDARGRRRTDFVPADSADAAMRTVAAEGWRDVVLHSDDVVAHLLSPNLHKQFAPKDVVKLGRMTFPVYVLFWLRRFYLSIGWLLAVDLGWLCWRRWQGDEWEVLDYLLVIVPVTPLLFLPLLFLRGLARKYARLLQAVVAADWEDVLERVEALKPSIAISEIAYRKAQALVALGDVDEGLSIFRKLEFTGDIPDWLYWCLLGELLFLARRNAQGLAASAKAVELGPNNATVLLSHADSLLMYFRDVAAASPIHERIKQLPVSDLMEWGEKLVDGMLALESGEPAAARRHLQIAMAATDVLHANGLVPLVRAKIDTYLCLACAAQGDHAAARRYFQRAEPFLKAHRRDELLERCVQAVTYTTSA